MIFWRWEDVLLDVLNHNNFESDCNTAEAGCVFVPGSVVHFLDPN